jgi:hypothetical protein
LLNGSWNHLQTPNNEIVQARNIFCGKIFSQLFLTGKNFHNFIIIYTKCTVEPNVLYNDQQNAILKLACKVVHHLPIEMASSHGEKVTNYFYMKNIDLFSYIALHIIEMHATGRPIHFILFIIQNNGKYDFQFQ